MYLPHVRRSAVQLLDSGLSYSAVARRTGINRSTLREWFLHRDLIEKYQNLGSCVRCEPISRLPEPQIRYSYLLGLYLGDGCISHAGNREKGVWALRIICADAWPGLVQECVSTLEAVLPGHQIGTIAKPGCCEVVARWKHWPCYFPQHGPGPKHVRPIELAPWQRDIVDRHPQPLVRGLFHSDGCRVTNRVRRQVAGTWKHYEYPRYFFTNTSRDILDLMGDTLDRLGVEWRIRWKKPASDSHQPAGVISVAEKRSVALLDSFIGPKH
ncbi:helix-turn-helix domain-containing protein [Marinitenerispora sediminis]|uniref:Transcriptional regulator n=1 Tax=Marinitenerispora sediminis TaxID=1931232 RepID=A0A368TA52_9ACTN|nr:helix-turn-helix domain-containing protein [Marinitenerispora sediminis]RCV51677.1 transcriptional regulator [Marinitenerispora sediminis]RCV59475.1 transcriptional regulator [Marinitenerispora sediminis]RCV61712.1 transcriptional regulator [Marinitenerispora sediminis]